MILKTTVEYEEENTSKLTEEEKQNYTAKKEFLGKDFPEDELLMDKIDKPVIIDTDNGKMYIDIGEGKISMRHLLDSEFFPLEDGTVGNFFSQVVFKGNLDELYNNLLEEKKEKQIK